MEDGQKMFFNFIMERTQEDKREAMTAAIEEHFKPPQDGGFDPEAFKKGIELITSMLKPESVAEFQKMMNPFGDEGENSEPPEIKNVLIQADKNRWKDDNSDITKDDLHEAFVCSQRAHDMKCDCWNTHCVFYGDCRKCIVFHLCLKQFPTCQRALLGDLEEHYIVFSRDK